MEDIDVSAATSNWLSTPGRFQPLPSRSLLGDPRGLGVEVQRMFPVSVSLHGHGRRRAGDLESVCSEGIAMLEHDTGHRFAATAAPLLVAVRIASRPKVPGRSPAVLNVGLTREGAKRLAVARGASFAEQLLIRLMATYAHAVRRIPIAAIHDAQRASGEDGGRLIELLDELMSARGGGLPLDPERQLLEAVQALQASWNEPDARRDMEVLGIDPAAGVVAVQAMAYGNASERSGKGVAATRNPVTGAPGIHGQYTACYQGGIRLVGDPSAQPLMSMRRRQRTAYASLQSALALLEAAEQDGCAVEFVVENGALRVLDVRAGTSSGPASIRIAIDLVDAGLLPIDDAMERIGPAALRVAQQPVLRRDHQLPAAIEGSPASPGTAVGEVVLSAKQVGACAARGGRPILIQERYERYDAATIAMCVGVVSAGEGSAARASVLARMLGIPAIAAARVSAENLAAARNHDDGAGTRQPRVSFTAALTAGEAVVLDADHGRLYRGETDLVAAQPDTYVARVLSWCADHQRVAVVDRAPEEYVTADELDARGGAHESDAPVLIDTRGADEDTGRIRASQMERALLAGPRELALMWSDDLEDRIARLPPAPWSMIVAPGGCSWAALLLATRITVDDEASAVLHGRRTRA